MKFWAKNKKGFAEGSHSVGTRALFVKFLCIILCLVTCIGVPSTAYAKTSSVKKLDSFVFYNTDSTVPDVEGDAVTIPYWFKSSYPQYKYRNYQFYSDYFTAEDSDVITISIQLNNGQSSRYLSWEDFAINVRSNNYGNPITVAECDVTYDASISTFIATGTVSSGGNDLYLSFYAYNPTLTSNSPSVTFSFGVTDITIDTKSEQSGFFDKVSDFFQGLFDRLTAWFDSLFQWLRDIRDNASEGFSNIGNWFTELGNNIKSFFTDLTNNIKEQFTKMINNLKTFFADVGRWFSEIGDRIGEFFSNLWNNITVTINGITDSVREWWQGVVDFFHSLFVPEDGYFDKYKQDWEDWARLHFALFYDVMDFVDYFLSEFELEDINNLVITIPKMQLPILDKFVFIDETSVELGNLYNSHTSFKYFYDLYRICFSAACYFLLIKYLQKTLSEIITGDGDTL